MPRGLRNNVKNQRQSMQVSSVSRAFLESFSRVSREFLERISSDTRAIFERYSSDTRAILETYPTHLRSISGLVSRGIRVYSRAKERKIANSAKSISARSYQIVRNFTKSYQFLPNLTQSNKVLRSFAISCEFLPNLTDSCNRVSTLRSTLALVQLVDLGLVTLDG